MFFHRNTLPRSDANKSVKRRWTLLCCYNTARNDPFLKHHHPNYTLLKKVPNEEFKKAGNRFLDPKKADTFLKRTSVPHV